MTDPTFSDPLTASTIGGDVAAALDAARPNHDILDVGSASAIAAIVRREDVKVEIVDLERHQAAPNRQRGTVRALTANGFIEAVQRLGATGPVYANVDSCELVAVLNDDDAGEAGWRDMRVRYEPQATPEWVHWVAGQGLGDQDRFARIIEEGETEIRNPSATTMLDLAQTFHASTAAKFKQAGRLRDGRTQLVYEEEIDASAGEGLVSIPDTFLIELRPFYGAAPRDVVCRLRYRLDRGELKIGYQIHRPEEIRRDAFTTDVCGAIGAAGLTLLDAIPADPRT